MKLIRKAGATSEIWQIFIADSSSTTGAGLTGLTSASSGLTAYYHRDTDTTATAISLVTMTVGTFTSSGFKEIDSTNMPGFYQFCPPNAAIASGAKSCAFHLKGATNMAPLPIEVDLWAVDPQDGVHFGVSALPNTACTTNASLLTSGTGTDQLSVTTGRIDIGKALGTAVTLDANNVLNVSTKYLGGTLLTARDIGASVLLSAGSGTGQLDFTSGVVKANLAQILGTALTETAGQIAAAFKQFFNISSPTSTMNVITTTTTVTSVTNRVTANTDQWAGGTIPAPNVTGVPLVDDKYLLGTIYTTPATAGIMDVNVKNMNNVGATSITTINANQGTVQPVNFTGTAGSALVKSDMVDVAGAAVNTAAAQLGVNVVSVAGAASNIKKNQALNNFEFVMRDATTHAPKTGLTVSGSRNIDNTGFAACANAVTEVSNGWYVINLAASDLNGNVIAFRFTATGADDLDLTVVTQP